MPSDHPIPPQKCGRRTRTGGKCTQWVMRGQTVCKMHGGKSPQALASAEERMKALVHPALSRLQQLINHADADGVSLNAIKYVLDYAGFKATEKVTTDGRQVIEVEYVGRAPATVFDVPHNGIALE